MQKCNLKKLGLLRALSGYKTFVKKFKKLKMKGEKNVLTFKELFRACFLMLYVQN